MCFIHMCRRKWIMRVYFFANQIIFLLSPVRSVCPQLLMSLEKFQKSGIHPQVVNVWRAATGSGFNIQMVKRLHYMQWDLDSVPILNLPSTQIKNVSFAADSYTHTNEGYFLTTPTLRTSRLCLDVKR